MSVSVKIGDRAFEVAVPYKLRQIEAAAPFIDEINAAAREVETSMVGMSRSFRAMLGAILPGIVKADPSVTLDMLIDEFDPGEWQALRAAFDAIFNRSGIASGEAPAPAPAEPAAA